MALNVVPVRLLMSAPALTHEIRTETTENIHNTGQRIPGGPDVDFIAHALYFQLHVRTFIGQLGRDADGLGIAVSENFS